MPDNHSALDETQSVQELQYSFPYHYIPSWEGGAFSQNHYWSWGFRYLGGIRMALDLVSQTPFSSLLDIGCGDGRFLREVRGHFPEATLKGVDYSPRAVGLARAFNPDIQYECSDIIASPLREQFDVATMIEVLEHIPPEDCAAFVKAARDHINPGGLLVATVPHVNKPTNEKHYRHFSGETLCEVLSPQFEDFRLFPFDDVRSVRLKLFSRAMGGTGNFGVITHAGLNRAFFDLYLSRYLKLPDETKCGRIAVIARARS